MLPSRSRLSRRQFEQLLANSDLRVAFNRLGTLKYIAKQGHFTVVVSSKHEKRAVARNKLRRRLYSLFQQANPAISGILYVSKGVYGAEYVQLQTLFYELIAKTTK